MTDTDPGVRLLPRRQGDRTIVPPTGHPGGLQAQKLVFPSVDDKPVEIRSLFGKQGEKMHVRTRPARVR